MCGIVYTMLVYVPSLYHFYIPQELMLVLCLMFGLLCYAVSGAEGFGLEVVCFRMPRSFLDGKSLCTNICPLFIDPLLGDVTIDHG